ncbi:hypothetical protein [Amycolatopsis sp. EV170708-02-1]|uniref:hypothetical protein n=1 Tax=Amycolatopsis sp. EV170708-02-1 TaxID=2919322 RepID=UPI001F0BED99|nr:hypothetical protein [Amycolatopsis sp. EV170708-02-1]UMP04488.1 hypothetical protein MJQ72_06480 [Amycolatopsis sp. EV170708-02-1]
MMPSAGTRRRIATTATVLGTFALVAPSAQAAETTVPCAPAALVKAVADANATPEPDALSLAPNCVYTLTEAADARWNSGLPSVEGKLTIHGNHATIERAKDAPRFRIITNWGDLTLNEITITGGHAPDGAGTNSYGDANPGGSGGGIQNWGPLTITDSIISGNTAGAGARGADATATTYAGSGGSGGFGGGISSYSSSRATLTITRTTITGNASGAGGPGGNGVAAKPGGRGGAAGYGGGVEVISGTVLRIIGGSVTGNSAGSGGKGGTGGAEGGGAGDGGSGGVAGGVFLSSSQGLLNPAFTGVTVSGNQAGRGGDAGIAGPGGYSGYSGYGGRGGGIGVFDDNLTLDAVKVGDNAAGEPGAGSYPSPASGGGIHTLNAHVTLVNGAVVSGNLPDNCVYPADVPGCVNDFRTAEAQGSDQRAVAERAAVVSRG